MTLNSEVLNGSYEHDDSKAMPALRYTTPHNPKSRSGETQQEFVIAAPFLLSVRTMARAKTQCLYMTGVSFSEKTATGGTASVYEFPDLIRRAVLMRLKNDMQYSKYLLAIDTWSRQTRHTIKEQRCKFWAP
jgi:hypothetical protein